MSNKTNKIKAEPLIFVPNSRLSEETGWPPMPVKVFQVVNKQATLRLATLRRLYLDYRGRSYSENQGFVPP